MKLKEYLKSLLLKKHKKIDKISEITDDKIAETLQKEEEDDTNSWKDWKENQTEKPGWNLWEDEKKSDFDVPQEDQD